MSFYQRLQRKACVLLMACATLFGVSACGTADAVRKHGLIRTPPFAGTVRAVNSLRRADASNRGSAELLLRSADIGACLVADTVVLGVDAVVLSVYIFSASGGVFHYGR